MYRGSGLHDWEPSQWRSLFAYLPMQVNGRWVWWKWVQRRCVFDIDQGDYVFELRVAPYHGSEVSDAGISKPAALAIALALIAALLIGEILIPQPD
jgi:hypothetical protein